MADIGPESASVGGAVNLPACVGKEGLARGITRGTGRGVRGKEVRKVAIDSRPRKAPLILDEGWIVGRAEDVGAREAAEGDIKVVVGLAPAVPMPSPPAVCSQKLVPGTRVKVPLSCVPMMDTSELCGDVAMEKASVVTTPSFLPSSQFAPPSVLTNNPPSVPKKRALLAGEIAAA